MKSNIPWLFLSMIAGIVLASTGTAQDLAINEVMSANVWSITDEDDDHSDWIELYNGGYVAVNLNGYGLSDDPLLPFRWVFPSVTIQPGDYLIIFASGKDRTAPNLHTNFKIKSDGEPLLLTNPSGATVDQIETGYIPSDISRGRQPDGVGELHYFAIPTPEQSNTTPGYLEITDPPEFMPPAGFYSGSLALEINAPSPEAVIHYTLDGSPPIETSPLYTSPMSINQTTAVRARAFVPNCLFSDITTNSYILYDNNDLAIVSLATHPDNFFDPQIGIYVWPNFNFDWERPIHVEFFESDGSLGFSEDAGVQTVGGNTLMMNAQKSLALFARDKYHCEHFDYQIFSEKPITEFKSFVLRNSGNDWSHTMMRDPLMQGLIENTGVDIQAYRPSIVFLNGDYWGIHNVREKQNEDYLASNHGVNPDSVDMLEGNAQVIEGSAVHYNAMINFLETHNIQIEENYEYIKTQMDVTEFIKYELSQIYFANSDWPGRNIKFWRPQQPDGIWRWLLYDTDAGFGLWETYAHNTLAWATAPNSPSWFNPPWSTFLLRTLLENDDFSSDFINYFADFLNFEFEPLTVINRIDEMSAVIGPEMPNHRARWNLGTMAAWYNDIDELREFAENRPDYVCGDILDYFNLSGTAQVSLDVNPQGSGMIQINSKLIEEYPWTGVYFQEASVPLMAVPEAGYHFVSWLGVEPPDSSLVLLDLRSDTSIIAQFEPDTSDHDSIVITEINYNSSPDFDPEDWLEFYNNSDENVDLSNWVFKDAYDTNAFIFPTNTILEHGGFLVLCRDSAAFSALFPGVTNILGNLDFNLSNGGELIRLFNASGDIVDSLTYDDDPPWPPEPDGQGPTLELLNPDLPNHDPENWRASLLPHGSPGCENGWVNVNVSLTPYGLPIQIPASGGSFDYNIAVAVMGTAPQTIDIWIMATLPSGTPVGPLLGPVNVTLPGGATVDRDRTQMVPGNAPEGTYTYFGYVGIYPNIVWDDDSFTFEKLGADAGSAFTEWKNWGEPFNDNALSSNKPRDYALLGAFPNPFNPTTAISFQLPTPSLVNLTVYDISGRKVAELVNGRREVGTHEVTFDGSTLASGIYIYRLEAGNFRASGKMVLLK